MDQQDDPIFQQEQEHLSEVYTQLLAIRKQLVDDLEVRHKSAAKDLRDLSDEVRIDFGGADETMETLASIETLNSVIDSYNQLHDFTVEKLGRVTMLLHQPYFAKVRLKMRPDRPSRDVYIGSAGIMDDHRRPLVVDWRSPVAETYYNQEMGKTSYEVDGRTRTVDLELRRQFDILKDRLRGYFDTTVAIEDSLLLAALQKHHSEKLTAITATIQREQNEVIRHADVPVLLVNGIAGSGKTSVLLQRIAFLLYRERKTLNADQVWLFTPNDVFASYIDAVLPSMGERNPRTHTWSSFLEELGLADHADGADGDPARLHRLEQVIPHLTLTANDVRGISKDGVQLLRPAQVAGAVRKFERFGIGTRFAALVTDELHTRLDRRFKAMSADEELQEQMLGLDVDEQVEIFGSTIAPDDEAETVALTRRYVEHLYGSAHDAIDKGDWLRIDRIGMQALDATELTAAEWIYTKLLILGNSEKDARYVMIDEVQDYTLVQLMVLARYFSRAHFLLLGDAHQAIREGTASFDEIKELFSATHGQVEECRLLTSYRSSPEITSLFCSLLAPDERLTLSSVHRPGIAPEIHAASEEPEAYLAAIRAVAEPARDREGLAAVIVDNRARAHWLASQLPDLLQEMGKGDRLPKDGIVLLDLELAKGLEFDEVIIPDAQASTYPDTPLARRRLYTAISRAMHRVTILSQGPMTTLLPR